MQPEARGRRRVGGLHTTWAGGEDRCTDVPTPAQVSANRRARVLQQETTTASHVTNIYHMHRRIGTMYSRQERLKNPWDLSGEAGAVASHPPTESTDPSHRRSDMLPWHPRSHHACLQGTGFQR